jgi:hypothetical protein
MLKNRQWKARGTLVTAIVGTFLVGVAISIGYSLASGLLGIATGFNYAVFWARNEGN